MMSTYALKLNNLSLNQFFAGRTHVLNSDALLWLVIHSMNLSLTLDRHLISKRLAINNNRRVKSHLSDIFENVLLNLVVVRWTSSSNFSTSG